MSEFCNEITYAKKWETKELRKKSLALTKKYRTCGWSDCPYSWVDEVEELLKCIDKKFGIAKFEGIYTYKFWNLLYWKFNFARLYNFIFKPQVRLDQFKEKFGTLRVYYCASDLVDDEVGKMVDACQVKLIKKLKYPYKILKCTKCGVEATWYTGDEDNKLCRYCNSKVIYVKQTTKTSKKKRTSKNSKKL